jgi:hypothetical protein
MRYMQPVGSISMLAVLSRLDAIRCLQAEA